MRWTATLLVMAVLAAGVPVSTMQGSGGTRRPSVQTTTEIAARSGPATVTIVAFNSAGKEVGQGSGFIVRSDGVIVTNWHVMSGATSASVRLKTGETFDRVLFLDGDEAGDIAVLKVLDLGCPQYE